MHPPFTVSLLTEVASNINHFSFLLEMVKDAPEKRTVKDASNPGSKAKRLNRELFTTSLSA